MTSISCWPTWGHQSWAFSLSVSQWCTPELPRSGSPPVGSSTSLWWCRSRSHGGPHGGCGGASVAGWCAMLVTTALAEGDRSMCVTTCESGLWTSPGGQVTTGSNRCGTMSAPALEGMWTECRYRPKEVQGRLDCCLHLFEWSHVLWWPVGLCDAHEMDGWMPARGERII